MTAKTNWKVLLLASAVAMGLAGCEGVQDTSARVTPVQAGAEPGTAATQQVSLQPFTMQLELGQLPGRIGERTTVGSVSMGYVTLDPPPEIVMTDAVRQVLNAAGYGTSGGNRRVTGEVTRFALSTPATPTYWDVQITAAARISIEGSARDYSRTCVERTYLWPSDALIAGLAQKCAE